jgi:excisionase family DNA binding protein
MVEVIPLEQRAYTYREVAKKLSISQATLYRMIERGQLKTVSFSVPGSKRPARRVSYQELCRLITDGVPQFTTEA